MHAVPNEGNSSCNELNGTLMQEEVRSFATNLSDSASLISKGLGKLVSTSDIRSLLAVKEHLRALTQTKDNTENAIAANRAALLYLKKKSIA